MFYIVIAMMTVAAFSDWLVLTVFGATPYALNYILNLAVIMIIYRILHLSFDRLSKRSV